MRRAEERRELRRALAQNRRDLAGLKRTRLCEPWEGPCVCGVIDQQIRDRQQYIVARTRACNVAGGRNAMIPSQDQLALPLRAVLEQQGPMRGRDVADGLAERVGVGHVERRRTVVVGEKNASTPGTAPSAGRSRRLACAASPSATPTAAGRHGQVGTLHAAAPKGIGP